MYIFKHFYTSFGIEVLICSAIKAIFVGYKTVLSAKKFSEEHHNIITNIWLIDEN